MRYYLFRVGQTPKDYQFRIEKAKGPRMACKLAFGVVYSQNPKISGDSTGGVRYKDIGSRSPRYMSAKAKNELYASVDGWEVVPNSGD